MTKTLVAYFSASGVTERTAEKLAKSIGADIYAIKPEVPYTREDLNWNNKQSRSSLEMNDPNSRPALAETGADFSEYDEILIGFPVWWYIAPTIINTFLETYDLTGKTIRLFATSGGSGIENCEKNLQQQYPALHWEKGALLNNNRALDAFAGMI